MKSAKATQSLLGPVMEVFHYGFFSMGTRFEMVLPGTDTIECQALAESVEKRVLNLEAKLSRFDPQSAISEVNLGAFRQPVTLDIELWELFSLCHEFHYKTKGAFDIAFLPLIQFWKDFFNSEGSVEPPPEQIENLLGCCGMHHLELDPSKRTVRFHHPDVKVDLGGIGKGYALQKTLDFLKFQSVETAFISFGESSVSVIGRQPNGKPWPVGLDHLFQQGRPVHTFEMTDASLSTSGNSVNGSPGQADRFGHIINPLTGYPVSGNRILSVLSESPVEAEAFSTALLATESSRREEILDGWFGGKAIEFKFSIEDHSSPMYTWKFGF